jgi:hypothetical protein
LLWLRNTEADHTLPATSSSNSGVVTIGLTPFLHNYGPSGSNNTFLGSGSAASTGTLTNATALGSNAVVAQSNAVVLGCLSGQNNCGENVNVGIDTPTPAYSLDVGGGDAIVRGRVVS